MSLPGDTIHLNRLNGDSIMGYESIEVVAGVIRGHSDSPVTHHDGPNIVVAATPRLLFVIGTEHIGWIHVNHLGHNEQ